MCPSVPHGSLGAGVASKSGVEGAECDNKVTIDLSYTTEFSLMTFHGAHINKCLLVGMYKY